MSFRFLHTADWHLGRVLYGTSLIEDQAWALDRLVDLVRDVRPHAVVIAGDVYDRSVPPKEALNLLDEVLSRLVGDLRVPVVLVAGNHDSPERLGFASALLEPAGLHVAGGLDVEPRSVVLTGPEKPVRFWLLPYADPIATRAALRDDRIHDHGAAVRACLAGVRVDPRERNVLVTHHFVVGGVRSDSERVLSVGGSGAVPGELFSAFEYVALGHLHRPQTAGGRAALRYSGSLLKYSFDEVGHQKSVCLVELGPDGPKVEEQVLGARRDVRRIEACFAEVMAGAARDPARDDYLEIVLLDQGPVHDAVGRIRTVYPNVLLAGRRVDLAASPVQGEGTADFRTLDEAELYARFFHEATGETLGPDLEVELRNLLDEFLAAEREETG